MAGVARSGAAEAPQAAVRTLTQDQIMDIFEYYCNFGRSAVQSVQDSMDSFMFMKFARECPHLLEGGLSRTEIDLIFTKAKPKYERRLDFEHFLDALSAIAEKKYEEHDSRTAHRLLLHHHLVPHFDFVQAQLSKTGDSEIPLKGVFKKLYDPSNYTGVYAERFRSGDGRINGEADNRPGRSFRGNTNTGTNEVIHDISTLMRPNLHGKGTSLAEANRSGSGLGASGGLSRSGSRRAMGSSSRSFRSPSRPGSSRDLRRGASGAAAGGAGGGMFSPMGRPREEGSGPRAAPRAAAPPIDPKAESAALLVALEKAKAGDPTELLALTKQLQQQAAAVSGGGESKGPEGDAVEGEGEGEGEAGFGGMADGEEAEAEALEEEIRRRHAGHREAVRGAVMSPDDDTTILSRPPPLTQTDIMEVFEYYCNFGRSAVQSVQDSMDSFMFMKFAKECPGLLEDGVSRTDVDLIFTKAKPKGERRLTFTHFLDALSAIAEKKYSTYEPADGLRLLIGRHLAPHHEWVLDEMDKTGESEIPLKGIFKKLYDPSNYTGVYAERFRSGDGRINGEADNRPGRSFRGNTNTGTDEVIHDISSLMRPHLRGGTMMKSRQQLLGGSPRKAGSSRALSSPRGGRGKPMPHYMAATKGSRAKEAVMGMAGDETEGRGPWS